MSSSGLCTHSVGLHAIVFVLRILLRSRWIPSDVVRQQTPCVLPPAKRPSEENEEKNCVRKVTTVLASHMAVFSRHHRVNRGTLKTNALDVRATPNNVTGQGDPRSRRSSGGSRRPAGRRQRAQKTAPKGRGSDRRDDRVQGGGREVPQHRGLRERREADADTGEGPAEPELRTGAMLWCAVLCCVLFFFVVLCLSDRPVRLCVCVFLFFFLLSWVSSVFPTSCREILIPISTRANHAWMALMPSIKPVAEGGVRARRQALAALSPFATTPVRICMW